MTQNNLYMEDENLRLYVDVQPLLLDELENSKNIAVECAQSANQSAQNAQTWLDSIISYKTNIELIYSQAVNDITSRFGSVISSITEAKEAALETIQSLKNQALSYISDLLQEALSSIQTAGQNIIDQLINSAEQAIETIDNNISEDYLIQSNALLSGGISTKSNVLDVIKRSKYTSFDTTKFSYQGGASSTNNGIATTISKISYVNTNHTLDTSNPWSIRIKIKTQNDTNIDIKDSYLIGDFISNGYSMVFGIGTVQSKACFKWWSSSNGSSWNVLNGVASSYIPQYDTEYYLELGWSGTVYYLNSIGENEQKTRLISYASATPLTPFVVKVGNAFKTNDAKNFAFKGNMDLKYFSIEESGVVVMKGNKTGTDTYTINGNSVVIPYTESKTGSKIVDSAYRGRVQALYEQEGYAPYYTLGENDFTLPMGEIYGMIENLRKLIIERTSS